jgi:hypothetical protein
MSGQRLVAALEEAFRRERATESEELAERDGAALVEGLPCDVRERPAVEPARDRRLALVEDHVAPAARVEDHPGSVAAIVDLGARDALRCKRRVFGRARHDARK